MSEQFPPSSVSTALMKVALYTTYLKPAFQNLFKPLGTQSSGGCVISRRYRYLKVMLWSWYTSAQSSKKNVGKLNSAAPTAEFDPLRIQLTL